MTEQAPPIDALRALWAEAERKLYPLATVSPQKYEQLIRLARESADDLAVVDTVDGLAAHWPQGTAIVRAASARADLPLGDLPEGDVAGVAFALRDAELRAAEHQRHLDSVIRAATERGDTWALIHETGDLNHGLANAYSAIELHLSSGAAIVASVEPNPVDGSTNHVLNVIRLDPATGSPVDLDPGVAELEEHPTVEEFVSGREKLKKTVEAHV